MIFGALAAAAYGLNPLFALPLYKQGFSVDMVLFSRYFLAMLMLGGMLCYKRTDFRINLKQCMTALTAGIFMVISSLTLFLSYQYMDAGLASAVLFIYPVLVAVIMGIGFKEKISLITIVSLILALIGLAMLAGNGGGSVSGQGIFLALLSAVSFGGYIVLVKVSPARTVPSELLTFYVLLFGIPIFLARLRGGLDIVLPDSGLEIGCMLGLAFFPTIIAFVFMALAIQRVGATAAAILGVLEPVTALAVGVLVFGEKLTLLSVGGIVFIIGAVMMVVLSERNKKDIAQTE